CVAQLIPDVCKGCATLYKQRLERVLQIVQANFPNTGLHENWYKLPVIQVVRIENSAVGRLEH
ncbi:MAG TPA: hypothetical protein VND66_10150, partial [Acidobacteriaceae bacterium]|nr:hypothetical protein [Acidobacteriaceae bacterium]